MTQPEHADPGQVGFDASVARLAVTQHGVFAQAQLAPIGGTRSRIEHRVKTGRWERCAPGVFRMAGAPPSWEQSLFAACLAWGDGAAASHRAAAALAPLAGFDPGPLELTVPRGRDRCAPGTVHRSTLPARDVTVVYGIPVTVPARTLIDIAAVAPKDIVEEALDDALRRRLVSPARMRWELRSPQRGRPGIAVMRDLVAARSGAVPESVMETRCLRLLRRARLPEPVRQHRITDRGRTVAIVDFAYPDAKLAIEADGYRWHSGRRPWEHDRARRNRLTLLGWRVIHVTWTDLERDPDAVVASIRGALRT